MNIKIPENKKLISPDNNCFEYMGRIDFENPQEPLFIWTASTVDINFTGTSCAVILNNIPFFSPTHFGALVDGVMQKFFLQDGEQLVTLAENLEDAPHTLKLVKTMGAFNYVGFGGIIIDKNAEISAPNHRYDLKLEVYGDSVSAGEVVEDIFYEGQFDPPDHHSDHKADNAYFSYPMILARRLNAELHDIAQGGIALLDGTGFFCDEKLIGMEHCYDKLRYTPMSKTTPWDFSLYTPDIVLIAIGQNDHQPNAEKIKTPEFREFWKSRYKAMLADLMSKYPNAKFLLMLTVMNHEPTWDDAIAEITREVNSDRVTHFKFTRTGSATYGHPRAVEQSEMAAELYHFIKHV